MNGKQEDSGGGGSAGDEPADRKARQRAARSSARARARSTASRVFQRLNREARWTGEVEQIKNDMIAEAKAGGMDTATAKEWAYAELDLLYPPLPKPEDKPATEAPPPAKPANESGRGRIQGLGEIPEHWPALQPNASLQSDIAWVQAQRLRVCEEKPTGAMVVHLARATAPAPSMSAIGWLETSIRSYAKFVDVATRTLASTDDDAEHIRRERMAIEEIKALLGEMIDERAAQCERTADKKRKGKTSGRKSNQAPRRPRGPRS